MNSNLVRFFLGLMVLLALSGCEKYIKFNQKLTLFFETPSGSMEASSVTRIHFIHPTALSRLIPAGIHGVRSASTGEAVVADMGGGRYVFALLPFEQIMRTTLWEREKAADLSALQISRRVKNQTEPLDVPRRTWPRLVTFGNISDPASVQAVDPDDLAATFGAGYALTRVTVQATDAPVTTGVVEGVLGWLGEYPELPILPEIDPHDFSFAAKLRQGAFIRRSE